MMSSLSPFVLTSVVVVVGGGGLALHMSPGCPSHFILMNCKTFHTLRAQRAFEKQAAAR